MGAVCKEHVGVEKTGHPGPQLSRRSCHSGRACVSAELATGGPEHLTVAGVFEKLSISLISNSNHTWLLAWMVRVQTPQSLCRKGTEPVQSSDMTWRTAPEGCLTRGSCREEGGK